MVQERGYYTIELSDEFKIDMHFNVEALLNFGKMQGLSFMQLLELTGQDLTDDPTNIPMLFLAGHQMVCKEKKQDCTATYSDACEWLATIGVGSTDFLELLPSLKEAVEHLVIGKKKMLKAV